MPGRKDVTIWVQPLGTPWESIGTDRARGVWAEGVSMDADQWGPASASFELHRSGYAQWPDLGAFTPVDIDVGGVRVWSGRVKETPTRTADRVVNVQCEGWQFHLDDDLVDRTYVETDLTQFKDYRSLPGASLSQHPASGQVEMDGTIVVSFPSNTMVATNDVVAVTLDLGMFSGAIRAVVSGESSNSVTDAFLYLMGHNTLLWTAGIGREDWVSGRANNAGASFTLAATVTSLHRYITLLCVYTGGGGTWGAIYPWFRINSLQLFRNAGYESGNASVLKASQVAKDILPTACPLLSADLSGIQDTSTSLPSYKTGGPQTARTTWGAVNAIHGWQTKIDEWMRPVYRPLPAVALYELGPWSAVGAEDASANSGQDIYNRTIVTAESPDGQGIVRPRLTQATAGEMAPGAGQLSNPGAEVDTTGWTASIGTLTRDTGNGDNSTAAFAVTALNDVAAASSTYAQTLVVGRRYRIRARCKYSGNGAVSPPFAQISVAPITSTTGQRTVTAVKVMSSLLTTSYQTFETADFIAETTNPTVTFAALMSTASGSLFFDNVQFLESATTLIDRRGFVRATMLPISNALPSDLVVADILADTYLAGHKTTPFRGQVPVAGPTALREIVTGAPVPPELLLTKTAELVQLSDRTDPDSGGHGRTGRIAAVSYSAATDLATVTLDNSRQNFEAVAERMRVFAG